jgi:hypothetical protein
MIVLIRKEGKGIRFIRKVGEDVSLVLKLMNASLFPSIEEAKKVGSSLENFYPLIVAVANLEASEGRFKEVYSFEGEIKFLIMEFVIKFKEKVHVDIVRIAFAAFQEHAGALSSFHVKADETDICKEITLFIPFKGMCDALNLGSYLMGSLEHVYYSLNGKFPGAYIEAKKKVIEFLIIPDLENGAFEWRMINDEQFAYPVIVSSLERIKMNVFKDEILTKGNHAKSDV